MTLKSISAQYPPDKASFLWRAAPRCSRSSLSICVKQEMSPDDTWQSTDLRPPCRHCQLVYLIKQESLNLKQKRVSPLHCETFHFLLVILLCHPQLPQLLFGHLTFSFSFLCFSVLDRMMWKQSIRLYVTAAGSLRLPRTLKCGESNFDTKSCGLRRSGTLKNLAIVARRNTTALVLFLILRQGEVFSWVLASPQNTTDA